MKLFTYKATNDTLSFKCYDIGSSSFVKIRELRNGNSTYSLDLNGRLLYRLFGLGLSSYSRTITINKGSMVILVTSITCGTYGVLRDISGLTTSTSSALDTLT